MSLQEVYESLARGETKISRDPGIETLTKFDFFDNIERSCIHSGWKCPFKVLVMYKEFAKACESCIAEEVFPTL